MISEHMAKNVVFLLVCDSFRENVSHRYCCNFFSCLPSDLVGAVRQSGEASASFVNSGGTRAIVRASE